MINNIINKIRKSITLADHEREYLEHVIAQPSSPEFVELYLAGIV